MIIVKTKKGDRFINDKAVTMVEHDRVNAVVNVNGENGVYYFIEDVEGIIYTSDAKPTEWKDEGSEIQRLKAIIEKKDKESDQMLERSLFMREWFFIYQNAFEDIKNAFLRAKNGSKCEDSVIDALIEQAETKYRESQKRFEEVIAKWKK